MRSNPPQIRNQRVRMRTKTLTIRAVVKRRERSQRKMKSLKKTKMKLRRVKDQNPNIKRTNPYELFYFLISNLMTFLD